ncbi:MAG TPA: YqaJ viral recombinase family protein [Gemmatimonadales bacterium]|nr:YqaJ viral recombinase family protein [Gemmatimonadales bacterium]
MRRFTICDAPQRSAEWYQARLGKLTASRAADMLATIRSGEAAARRDLRVQLVCERLTGRPQEDEYVSAAMQRGIDCEPLAFAAYEAHTGQVVQRTGFLSLGGVMAGCSPDGYLGDFEGLIELKCPKSATHLSYWQAGTVPATYRPQLLHQLWVTGAAYVDFVSFDDRWPDDLQLFVARLERDDAAIAAYERQALAFLAEVDTEVAAWQTRRAVGTVLRAVVGDAAL